jgi:hypothetical protein
MSKINLRRSSSFITRIYQSDTADVISSSEPRKRLENIAWPSESLAQLGPIAVGECKRTMFYKILGVTPTEPMSVHGRGICDAGLMYEEYQINKFKRLGLYADEQIPISFTMPDTDNKITCTGRMDLIIKDDNVKKVIEIKSLSAWKAPAIMGDSKNLGLPAVKNLMQAMLYKYFISTEVGKKLDVEEVYLMYINRSDGSVMYYRVDLDDEGYAIITSIDQKGKEGETIKLQDVPSFVDLLASSDKSEKDESRLAELRVRVQDIFSKFDLAYDYARQEMLPEPDYKHVYSLEDIEQEFKLGRVSKIKYNAAKKGESLGDSQCQYCPYLTKCLSDSGLKLK